MIGWMSVSWKFFWISIRWGISVLHKSDSISVSIADWQESGAQLSDVRRDVFIIEQKVPKELEWDGRDEAAIHAMATTQSGEVIGTARLLPEGQIGRMAVLRPWRKHGIGTRLLHCLIDSTHNSGHLFLNAQTSAESFYRNNGFLPDGEIFMEAGIPHIRMIYRPSK
jgi:predicted GNAT family N-acyltransferase